MTVGRYVLVETLIAALFSVAFNAGIGWLALHTLQPITLLGLPGLGVGFLPATFMTCLMVTLAATLLTRLRRRQGKAPQAPPTRTWLPYPAFVRALVVGFAATLVLAPIVVGLLLFVFPGPYSLAEALACNVVYAIALAIIVAPPLLRAALGEAPQPSGAT